MVHRKIWLIAVLACLSLVAASAFAADVKLMQKAGSYDLELNLLPAEPFNAPMTGMSGMSGMSQGHAGMTMIAKGGAAPVQMDDPSHPNHHLVVHVHDAATHKVVTDATVTISFTPVDANGNATGPATAVPVVMMEASGMGAPSTHYGNNVTMPPGSYRVDVTVNGAKTSFKVQA